MTQIPVWARQAAQRFLDAGWRASDVLHAHPAGRLRMDLHPALARHPRVGRLPAHRMARQIQLREGDSGQWVCPITEPLRYRFAALLAILLARLASV